MKRYIQASTKPQFQVHIEKCYDVYITDEEGNEVLNNFGADYREMVYGDKTEATKSGRDLLKQVKKDFLNGSASVNGLNYEDYVETDPEPITLKLSGNQAEIPLNEDE